MPREIDESIDGAVEVRALRARRWHMAIVSRQLYDNYVIRRQIFILKFLIKFVNNVANHLTPFFIFLIGGWFVIHGRLDIGALTAVLIACKDLASPWKELLTYHQGYMDMNARYASVMDNFAEDGEPAALLETAPTGPHALALSGAEIEGLEGPVTVHVPAGARVAVVAEDAAPRTAMLIALAGLQDGLMDRWTAGTPVLYRAAVYVPSDPRAFTGSLRTNLVQGLRFRPVAAAPDPEREVRRREAEYTGASTDDTEDEWIDPAESGYQDLEAVDANLLHLVRTLGLEDDLYTIGPGCRIDPAAAPRWPGGCWSCAPPSPGPPTWGRCGRTSSTSGRPGATTPTPRPANLFFALPRDPALRWQDFAADRAALRMLDHAGVRGMLAEIGLDICETLPSLFEGVAGDSTCSSATGCSRARRRRCSRRWSGRAARRAR